MANQNNSQFEPLTTIRVQGTVVVSHLVNAVDFNGQTEYEVGLSDVQFEDASQAPDPQAAAIAIPEFQKRVRPPKDANQKPVLWLKTPKYKRDKVTENHVMYLDLKKKRQIPTKNEVARGVVVTAYINCFRMPASGMLKDYNGVTGQLQAVAFADGEAKSNWYVPSANAIAGFDLISDEDAYGSQASAKPAVNNPTNVNPNNTDPFAGINGNSGQAQAPFNGNLNAGQQGVNNSNTQETANGLFGNTTANGQTAPTGGQSAPQGSQPVGNNPASGLFGNGQAPQNNASNGLFGNTTANSQTAPAGGQSAPQGSQTVGNNPANGLFGNGQAPQNNATNNLFGNGQAPQNGTNGLFNTPQNPQA